ncbi:MAG: hypothetical protein AABM30_08450 [Actinomycetota bacterium]
MQINAIQNTISSERFNRVMFALGLAVLVLGVVVLVFRLAGGSDNTSIAAQPNFRPSLPEHSTPLKNANGVTIKKFEQFDPQVRSTIRTFLATAVDRKNLGKSWAVIAPSMKKGYTFEQWKNAKALPVIPYPLSSLDDVTYHLDYASTKEILVDMGLTARPAEKLRPVRFRMGLVPVGKRWLVDYWMPLWTPQLPVN